MEKIGWVAILITGFIFQTEVIAMDPGTATGTLTIKGKKAIPLKYAYALQYDNQEGILDGPELRIFLTDQEVVQDSTIPPHNFFDLDGPVMQLVHEGKVHGIVFKLDSRNPLKGMNGTLLYPPANPTESFLYFTHAGTKPAFSKLQTNNNKAVGEIAYKSDGSRGFEITASFNTAILQQEPMTERLEGPKALESAPVRALLAFDKACRAGDIEAVRKLSSAQRVKELEAFKAQVGESEFKKTMQMEIPSPEKRKRQVKQVFIRGTRAVVVGQGEGGKSIDSVVQQNGIWKVE